MINKKIFPTNLKLSDVTPVFKNEDFSLSENYRPVSVLPTISKYLKLHKQVLINLFIWLQKKVQYTICIDDFNRKNRKDLSRSEMIYTCRPDELIRSIRHD